LGVLSIQPAGNFFSSLSLFLYFLLCFMPVFSVLALFGKELFEELFGQKELI